MGRTLHDDAHRKEVPPPGSYDAVDIGCTCPIMDNNHGKGWPGSHGEQYYWHTQGCPVHEPVVERRKNASDSLLSSSSDFAGTVKRTRKRRG